ncbi:hypothetical protein TGAM01_v209840 [Trichoderma gamsii]|uniref:polynucleotide adenylyltransferase n=1 Tax=Trichoderma gamsii TaxID=398673 RepID=A0A2P4ZAC0_9HYPO|nr:hypothetical protein TGAM01_v209840 [Trichoderma gamsii]PON21249.1 hypothetical protein TGAM01_v209840 [Trichoderma gamsii]
MDVPAEQTFEESHDTALCLIPPPHLWGPVNSLRSLNDEKFTKWPPHVTLVYPFVKPKALPDAAEALSGLDLMPDGDDISMNLEEAGVFSHRRHSTVFIRPKSGQEQRCLLELRDRIYRFLGWPKGREYQPHLTVAQSEDTHAAWHQFLLEKARLVTPLAWNTHQLAILVRDPVSPNKMTASRPMRLWGYIDLASKSLVRDPVTLAAIPELPQDSSLPSPQDTFRYDGVSALWKPLANNFTGTDVESERLGRLVVASYNVLAEFDWPPSSTRYSKLVNNILSERSSADILVLQEVTDQFLSFLLADNTINQQYPFSTHGSPQQLGIGPLPSHLNIMVLSKIAFHWKYLPAAKKHKGFAILTFPTIHISESSDSDPAPLILAACHLSRGLTDSALNMKRDEILALVEYLRSSFPQSPWVIAGDFNLASSSRTIDEGLEKGELSEKGLEYLQEIDMLVAKAGFQDSWLITRVGPGESSSTTGSHESSLGLYEGEQGATFDPTSNDLAAASSGVDNSRPQRYDRILVKKCTQLRPHGFNMFGQQAVSENGNASPTFASDHWGIRCLLLLSPGEAGNATRSSPNFQVNLHKAALSLGNFEELKASLVSSGQFPTAPEANLRKEAIDILQRILIEEDATAAAAAAETRSKVQLVLIPVGSFGLGVWTDLSDIDCLCVGNISSRVFFSLAVQKLRKASAEGVKILRRVMANTGTMLELEIRGIKFDLQYCAAAAIAQGYPDVLKRPSSDPVFTLPVQTLAKLKPARDLFYLRRSIPDITKYRVAHLFIKAWAQSRGLYAAKYGMLGGIHISSMLVPICKALANESEAVSTADILTTFFQHYSKFNWETGIVFDPFYHPGLKYHRTFREPLCLLGWHGPSLNAASTASISTVNALASELTRAVALIDQQNMTWSKFLGLKQNGTPLALVEKGAADFLDSYRSYIKISARYWGSSQQKGRKYLGWLESRCISILVDISRKSPSLIPRIWPARFADEDPTNGVDQTSELNACYLIGLKWDENVTDKSTTSLAAAEGSVHVILQEFESRIQRDDKYFDAESCWMSASISRRSSLGSVRLAPSQLYDYDGADSDLDEDVDSEELDESDGDITGANKDSRATKTDSSKPSLKAVKPPGAGKLRSAIDALNRIRWDVSMDSSDYLVGYEDRFVGAQEKALDSWKAEQTDEEFIPQHRILYFKRKSDGVIVWDRRLRVDTIFGSG